MSLLIHVKQLILVAVILVPFSLVHTKEGGELEVVKFDEKFDIAKNDWVVLEDGLKIQFLYHSHKRTMLGGPSSPLILQMKYNFNGEHSEKQHGLNINDRRTGEWVWNNYHFKMVDYEYNTRMQLIVSKTGN
jgi:hypothetical protein